MKHASVPAALLFSAATMALILLAGCAEDGQMGKLKDYDGNVYKTLIIGDQVWMGENLKALHYHDGTPIEGVMTYNDDDALVATYGRLYTFAAATDGETVVKGRIRGACPKKWHLPTDDDWKALEKHLGLPAGEINNFSWRGTTQGGMMKETGTEHWADPNADATNSSGFNALPAGNYNPGLGYRALGYSGYFWSSTADSDVSAWSRVLEYDKGQIGRYSSGQDLALSIRCIKD